MALEGLGKDEGCEMNEEAGAVEGLGNDEGGLLVAGKDDLCGLSTLVVIAAGNDDLCSLSILVVVFVVAGNDDLCSLSLCWRMVDGVGGMKVPSVVCEGAGGLLGIDVVEVGMNQEIGVVESICSRSKLFRN